METIGYFAARFLEPVERFRGKNDVRQYINGVMIEPHPQGGVTIAATDGHRLMMARDPNGHVDKQRIFRVPTPILSASKRKGAGRFYLLEGMCVVMNNSMDEVEPTDNPLLPEYDSTIGKVTHIDGKFPDVRKAIGDVDKRIKAAGGFMVRNQCRVPVIYFRRFRPDDRPPRQVQRHSGAATGKSRRRNPVPARQ